MADKITLKSKSYDGRYVQLVCTQVSNGGAKNTSTIKWTLSTIGGSVGNYSTGPTEVVINRTTVYSKSRVAYTTGDFPASIGSKSGELTVSHKTDGTKSIKVSLSTAIYTSSVSTVSETWELDKIARYGTLTQSLNSRTETTIKINWASDNTVDYLWYSTDNGSTWKGVDVTDGKSGTYTISGLSAGANYKIKTRIRRKDSQLTTDSTALSVTTHNYPYCTKSPNFKLGDPVKLEFYNPLSRAFKFYIIGNEKQIDVEYNCSTTSYYGVHSTTTSVPYLYATIPYSKFGYYRVKVVYDKNEDIRDYNNTYTIKESECCPNFTTFNYKDTNTKVTDVVGSNQILVKGLSNVTLEIPTANKMTTKNSAAPKNYVATLGSVRKSANYSATGTVSFPMGVINKAGASRISITAYDSRDVSKQVYKDVTVYDYAKPIVNMSIKRLNNFEAQSTLKVSGTYSLLTVGWDDKNSLTKVEYRYRETGGTWGNWTTLTTTISGEKFTCNDLVFSLDKSKSFEFEVKATDKLGYTTKSAKVDVGQAVFMISSNKKTAYLNGEEVATRNNVKQLVHFTQLSENINLNSIVTPGTYRSIQASHTSTMKNTPSGLNGGFTMHVYSWTATSTNTEYRRQELVYAQQTYIRHTLDSGATWSVWKRVALVDDMINIIYPLHSVYCSSKNENPASKFGGFWYLADKGFATFTTDGNLSNPLAYFTPTSNVTCDSCYVSRNHSTIRIRLGLTVDVAMSDTGMDLGTLNWSMVGIKNLPMGYFGQTYYTDAGNGGIAYNVAWDTGKITQTDVFDLSSIPAGNTFYLDMTFVVPYDRMLDSECDKFYFIRENDPNEWE